MEQSAMEQSAMEHIALDEDIVSQLFSENDRLGRELAIEKNVSDVLNARIEILEQKLRIISNRVIAYFAQIEDNYNVLPTFCRALHDDYLEQAKDAQPDILNMSTPLGMPLPLIME
jgi:hypothetical protein